MRSAAALALVTCGVLFSSLAHADDAEPPPKPRPTAPDTRSGRPTLGLELGLGRYFGNTESGFAQTTYASWGAVPSLQLAYPFSRHFAVEVWGSYGSFTAGTGDCATCKLTSVSAGAGAVYHLVDGIPFDPWFSIGVGYLASHYDLTPVWKADYTGISIPRLKIGMDYYVAPYLGFGPYVDGAVQWYLNKSPGTITVHDTGTSFTIGWRVVISPFS